MWKRQVTRAEALRATARIGVVAGAGVLQLGGFTTAPVEPAIAAMAPPTHPAGSRAQFDYLYTQRTNNCGLQPAMLASYPDSARLQGSCCVLMDWNHYQEQVRGLRAYRAVPLIPQDPYDIPVALAKRLLAYNASIQLTATQAQVYTRAMSLSKEKGPCCCKCWRYDTFAGLSKYLIVHQHFTAQNVAQVITLLDGCGGPP
jgi:hypothetical protein